jgi:hypothetical protein
MIALQSDCLLFQLVNGESVPCSAEMITIEIADSTQGLIDPEMLRHAAASVFHYFKSELARQTVTVGEFAQALEKVLRTLGLTLYTPETPDTTQTREADLDRIARESGESLELIFFQRLRDELRTQLRESPKVLRFRGLRGCVKQLARVKRWSTRCEPIQDQVVNYLRQCLVAEPEQNHCALVVE